MVVALQSCIIFVIPENASDCIVFANLSGGTWASDVLVKTRYGQIWAYSYVGKLLWTIQEPAGHKTAHQPRPIDVDRDGQDEILAGYTLLNPDGTIRWDLTGQGIDLGRGHMDCARVFRIGLCSKGDLTGNGVSDLIFSSNPASEICIFRNEKGKKTAGNAVLGTEVNSIDRKSATGSATVPGQDWSSGEPPRPHTQITSSDLVPPAD